MIQYTTSNGQVAYGQVTDVIQLMGEVHQSNRLGEILRRLSVLHVQLGTPQYIYPSQVVGPLAYRPLPAWSLGSTRLSYLIRPLTGLSETIWLVNNDEMVIDS
ncbi:hypothetical protein VP01_1781g2 [Puccinia sorghi]|uniref:Uncharacterized protein n=1 Tax=Puccinia sorghi TaxID=27349 RepID=A0A0L6VEN5_9BASI|nr:hypothetical protein VP01_1781g2 [Puccinia sorghi]